MLFIIIIYYYYLLLLLLLLFIIIIADDNVTNLKTTKNINKKTKLIFIVNLHSDKKKWNPPVVIQVLVNSDEFMFKLTNLILKSNSCLKSVLLIRDIILTILSTLTILIILIILSTLTNSVSLLVF